MTAANQVSKSGDFGPVVTQPAPNFTASRSERGPLAAMMNGTRGCCTHPGNVRPLRVSKYSPWKSTPSVVSSLSSSTTNSSNRSTFCRGVRSGPPWMVASRLPPEPMPQRNRPSDTSSSARMSRVSASG